MWRVGAVVFGILLIAASFAVGLPSRAEVSSGSRSMLAMAAFATLMSAGMLVIVGTLGNVGARTAARRRRSLLHRNDLGA
jgi:hypothetical protein